MKKYALSLVFMSMCTFIYSQNIPIIQLKPFELNSPSLQFSTYKPADFSSAISTLQEALWQREQRENVAGDKYVNFCKLLGEISMQLYNDRDLNLWYASYKENILADIEKNWGMGNYTTVSQLIDERTSDIFNDKQLLYRLDASEKYNKFRDDIMNNVKSVTLGQWWLETHPFCYEDCFDEYGNVIGYKTTEMNYPMEEFSWNDHVLYIRKNNLVQTKNTPEIYGDLFDYFSSNSMDFWRAVRQSYQFEVWNYKKGLTSDPSNSNSNWMLNKKELLFNNDEVITPREYYIRMLTSWIK